jgi:hypothetical protein
LPAAVVVFDGGALAGKHPQPYAASREVMHGIDKVTEVAPGPVELAHHQRVSFGFVQGSATVCSRSYGSLTAERLPFSNRYVPSVRCGASSAVLLRDAGTVRVQQVGDGPDSIFSI